ASLGTLFLCFACFGEKKIQKPHRLIFWHSIEAPKTGALLKSLVEVYNQRHRDVEVVPVMAGKQDRLLASIFGTAASRQGPDLIWAYPALTAQLAESGTVIPLDSYLQDKDFDSSSIFPILWGETAFRGKTWGLPFDTNNLAIFYNRRHFREAGLSIPSNWKEFRRAARKLSRDLDHDGKTDRYGFMIPFGREEWAVWTWESLLWQAGGDLFEGEKPAFDSPAGVKALGYWQDLLKDGSAILSRPEKGADPSDFLQGKVSMFLSGSWSMSELPRSQFGVFPLPRDRFAVTNIGGEALYLVKRGEPRQRMAWDFAKYLVSPEFQTAWGIRSGYLPVNRKALESPAYLRHLSRHPAARVFLNGLEYGRVRPSHPAYPMVSLTIGEALSKALSSKTPPKKALEEARRTVELHLGLKNPEKSRKPKALSGKK
ncbi:MAG TPA: ABC transporter substrate-binding protein, partial [Chroococcales cyanobacterium]